MNIISLYIFTTLKRDLTFVSHQGVNNFYIIALDSTYVFPFYQNFVVELVIDLCTYIIEMFVYVKPAIKMGGTNIFDVYTFIKTD